MISYEKDCRLQIIHFKCFNPIVGTRYQDDFWFCFFISKRINSIYIIVLFVIKHCVTREFSSPALSKPSQKLPTRNLIYQVNLVLLFLFKKRCKLVKHLH